MRQLLATYGTGQKASKRPLTGSSTREVSMTLASFKSTYPITKHLLKALSERYGVAYEIRLEEEFLALDGIPQAISTGTPRTVGSKSVRATTPDFGRSNCSGDSSSSPPSSFIHL